MTELTTQRKIDLIDYWLEKPEFQPDIPNTLKNEISEEDRKELILSVQIRYNNNVGFQIPSPKFNDAIRKCRENLISQLNLEKTIELIDVQKETLKKQTIIQEENKKLIKEQNKVNKIHLFVYIFFIIFTIILSITNFYFTNKIAMESNKISKLQAQILNRTSTPSEALIEVKQDWDQGKYTQYDFVDDRFHNESISLDRKTAVMDLYFINYGKMNSGEVICNLENPKTPFWTSLHPRRFENIDSLGFNISRLYLFWDNCSDNLEQCDQNQVPPGNYDLNIECRCLGCKENPVNYSVSFCIKDHNGECFTY